MKRVVAASGLVVALMLAVPVHAAQAPAAPAETSVHQALLQKNCITCHNERNKANAGRLSLEGVDVGKPADHPEVWEKVVAKVKAGLMPPSGLPRPEATQKDAFVGYLERELDKKAADLALKRGVD